MEQQLRNLGAAPAAPTDWMKPDPYDPRIKPPKRKRSRTPKTNGIYEVYLVESKIRKERNTEIVDLKDVNIDVEKQSTFPVGAQ